MFPEVPQDLSALSDDDLSALRDQIAAYASEATQGPLTDETIANLTRAADGGEAVNAEIGTRAEAAAQRQQAADEAMARIQAATAPTPVADPPAADPPAASAPAQAEPEPAAEPALAAAAPAVPAPVRTSPRPTVPPLTASQPPVPARATPAAPVRPTVTMTAALDVPDYRMGTELDGLEDVAEMMVRKFSQIQHTRAAEDENVPVVRIKANMPAERRLTKANSEFANQRLVESVVSPQAITAAGGLCAPVTPYYDIMVLADASRPVRDALPTFEADRGGIRLIPPPQFSAVQSSARIVADGTTTNASNVVGSVLANFSSFDVGATITGTGIPANSVIISVNPAANQATLNNNATATGASISFTITRPGASAWITDTVDAAALGGTAAQSAAALKPCLHVTCPAPLEVHVGAVTRCLEFGNFTARAYPEQVVAWTKLALAWQARFAENNLLTQIGNASVQVTAAQVLGTAREVPAVIAKAAAYLRNHNRMQPDARLRLFLPAWVADAATTDLIFGSGYEMEFYSQAREQFMAALADAANCNVSFYWDSGTGQGQLINSGNAQAAGALTAWPTTCVAYLFPEGSFVYLDGGVLDLGVVRDSVLNAGNNYRIFAETFENVVFIGLESLAVTMTINATGGYAPAGTAPTGF